MKDNPLVSVIIPVYNRAELLPRTLKSVVSQTYKDIEIIVVDDGSTEDIKSVVDIFNDSRIKYIKHSKNEGLSKARNTGMKIARGDFIAFLDSDDEYLPEKIEKQVRFLEKNRDIDVVYCKALEEKMNGIYYLRSTVGWKWFVWTQQIMIKKDVIEKIGFFDEKFPALEDVDYLYRLRKDCTFGFIDEPLMIYHNTPGSLSKDVEKRNIGRKLFINKHYDTYTRKQTSVMLYKMGRDYIYIGKVREGMKGFLRAYWVYPLNQKALRKFIRCIPLLIFYTFKRVQK